MRRSPSSQIFLTLLLGFSMAGAAAARDYRIELLVFENLGADNPTAENFVPRPIEVPEEPLEPLEPPEIARYPSVPAEELALTETYEKLLASRDYAPILLTGWVQPGTPRTETQAVAIGGSQRGRLVNGLAWFSVENYLRLRLELAFSSGGEEFRLNETRTRLRGRQLYFFDHPRFGVLATVTPL